jgi:hypothetical protein
MNGWNMVLPFLPQRSPTAQMLVLLMAAIRAKLPDLFTWSVWYQALLLALAGPDAASPATAASTVTAPASQRFITHPHPKRNDAQQPSTSCPLRRAHAGGRERDQDCHDFPSLSAYIGNYSS